MHEQLELFLAYMQSERSMSDNTTAAYRTDLEQCLEFLSGRGVGTWRAATAEDMQAFSLFLRERRYARSTIARRTAAVRSFYAFLKQGNYVHHDPTEQLDAPRVERRAPQALTPQQVDELLELTQRTPHGGSSPEGLRDRAMLELLYATGMRVSELVALNVADLNMDTKQVHCIGKRGERILPLTESHSALTALEEYCDIARPQLCRNAHPPEPALFLNHRGKRLTRQGFWLILSGYAREMNVSELTPHTLRHSFAIHKLREGEQLHEVQKLLGHASLSTTQIYRTAMTDAAPPPAPATNGTNLDRPAALLPRTPAHTAEPLEPQE